jgi:hypothetical protein
MVPEVYVEEHPEYTELYERAWRLAFEHIRDIPGLPVPRHMDEGFCPDRLWIWDTCFMVHFCKYAPDVFPGIQSLDNFYAPMHDGVTSPCKIHHPDNPPLFAWIEYEYYKFTGDSSRLYRNLVTKRYLQKHYEYIETARFGMRVPGAFMLNAIQKNEIGYFWSGIASGMDNTPRGGGHDSAIYWLDAISQQALSALYIFRMAEAIDETAIAEEYRTKYQEKCELINRGNRGPPTLTLSVLAIGACDICSIRFELRFMEFLSKPLPAEPLFNCQRTVTIQSHTRLHRRRKNKPAANVKAGKVKLGGGLTLHDKAPYSGDNEQGP